MLNFKAIIRQFCFKDLKRPMIRQCRIIGSWSEDRFVGTSPTTVHDEWYRTVRYRILIILKDFQYPTYKTFNVYVPVLVYVDVHSIPMPMPMSTLISISMCISICMLISMSISKFLLHEHEHVHEHPHIHEYEHDKFVWYWMLNCSNIKLGDLSSSNIFLDSGLKRPMRCWMSDTRTSPT